MSLPPAVGRHNPQVSRLLFIAVLVYALLLCVLQGCSALPPISTLGPTLEAAIPLRHGEKVAAVEPFAVIRPLEFALTYIEIDPDIHHSRGAWLSVNGGRWTTAATLRRGDVVDVAYTRSADGSPAASSLRYRFFGLTTRGWVRLVETRDYHDGYPATDRPLRVYPYETQSTAAAAP